ncbi:protein of unknown function (plasmid) [Escherichia coli]|nr:protein of unknown function [Escherichia coli]
MAICALCWSHCNHVLRIFLGNANNFNDIIYKDKRREAGENFSFRKLRTTSRLNINQLARVE